MPADFFFVAFEGWAEGCGVEAVGSGPEEEEVEAELSAGGDMLRAMGGGGGVGGVEREMDFTQGEESAGDEDQFVSGS